DSGKEALRQAMVSGGPRNLRRARAREGVGAASSRTRYPACRSPSSTPRDEGGNPLVAWCVLLECSRTTPFADLQPRHDLVCIREHEPDGAFGQLRIHGGISPT